MSRGTKSAWRKVEEKCYLSPWQTHNPVGWRYSSPSAGDLWMLYEWGIYPWSWENPANDDYYTIEDNDRTAFLLHQIGFFHALAWFMLMSNRFSSSGDFFCEIIGDFGGTELAKDLSRASRNVLDHACFVAYKDSLSYTRFQYSDMQKWEAQRICDGSTMGEVSAMIWTYIRRRRRRRKIEWAERVAEINKKENQRRAQRSAIRTLSAIAKIKQALTYTA
jgi:hypothetical protein